MSDAVERAATGAEIDKAFESGEDMRRFFDLSSGSVRAPETRQVNVSMSSGMVSALDAEAARVGVTRQAVIKMWLQERIDHEADRRARRQAVA